MTIDADINELLERLTVLRREHRELDAMVASMHETGVRDELKLARMKKRKLVLRDEIVRLEDAVNPDIIA